MSFGFNMRGVPYVKTYNEAVAMFEKAVPWRNGGDDRPLPGKRSRTYGVRMNGDDVVFRYHRTDVIRWHKDGSYEIDTGGYNSRSTCEFANHFMPNRHWLAKQTAHLRIGDWVYPIVGTRVTVSETGAVSGSGLGRFKKTSINRKKAKAMLTELGYYPYLAWHKLMYPMVQDTMPSKYRRPFMSESNVIEALQAGQDAYHDLMVSYVGEPDTVRELLYRARGAAFGIYNYTHQDRVENTNGYAVVPKEK